MIEKNIHPNLLGLKPSATLAINEKSAELIASGKKVYKLGLGQSPFPVPEIVVEELRKHAHEKDYLNVKGLLPLRAAIANYYSQKHNLTFNAENIIVGPGSKELLFLLQLSYGGDLLVPSPSWVSYEPQAKILGREVCWLSTSYQSKWSMFANEITEIRKKNPQKPYICILNYPSNPTGLTHDRSTLESLAQLFKDNNILVLSDEIYGELTYKSNHLSIAKFYPTGTVITGGLSKWAGAGGWRLGAAMFSDELSWLADTMAVVASETYTSVSAPIQYAAIAAFGDDPSLKNYLLKSREILSQLSAVICHKLNKINVAVHPPEGGFYIFPDFSSYSQKLHAKGILDSSTMCESILTDKGVAFLPGSCFGRPKGEFTARLAFVNFDGQKALSAAEKEKVDDSFIEKYCTDSLGGIDKIVEWFEGL